MSDGVGERQKGSRKARHALTPRQVGSLETAETEQELASLFEEIRVNILEIFVNESGAVGVRARLVFQAYYDLRGRVRYRSRDR
jgi:hypothetical protein